MQALAQFVGFSKERLAECDVAMLNLLCASGLPGADTIEIDRYLAWLDDAAHHVRVHTDRYWYRFNDSPATYNSSPGYYCCYVLLQVLQQHFGVRYNPERVRDPSFQDPNCFNPDFSDARDLFIHGIIDGPGGTCASLPVLYVAVGRRLGYPLKLVETRGHLFFRWEDPEGKCFGFPERFNIEGSGDGIAARSDEHYKTWPEPWTEADIAHGWYLRSLTPAEELASFLVTRGYCLTDNGRLAEACQAYDWACQLAPHDMRYQDSLATARRKSDRVHRLQLDRVTELNRRNRGDLLAHTLDGADKVTHTPGFHPANCRGNFAQTTTNGHVTPHGPSCQCAHCAAARGNADPSPGLPGHLATCQCVSCRPSQRTTVQQPHF